MLLEKKLPEEFKPLLKRKRQLKRELKQVNALRDQLKETRELLVRAMNFIGVITREEWEKSPSREYMQRFLEGRLGAEHL